MRRLLRPGGRYAFTAPESDAATEPPYVKDWAMLLEAAGLEPESKEHRPRHADQVGRMFKLWLEYLEEIRAEMGDSVAERLEAEARAVGPTLNKRRHLFVVATRPR